MKQTSGSDALLDYEANVYSYPPKTSLIGSSAPSIALGQPFFFFFFFFPSGAIDNKLSVYEAIANSMPLNCKEQFKLH